MRRYEITARQLDHWTTRGYLGGDTKNIGTGGRRDYTYKEVDVLEKMLALVRAGVRPEVASTVARGDKAAYNSLVQAVLGCENVSP